MARAVVAARARGCWSWHEALVLKQPFLAAVRRILPIVEEDVDDQDGGKDDRGYCEHH